MLLMATAQQEWGDAPLDAPQVVVAPITPTASNDTVSLFAALMLGGDFSANNNISTGVFAADAAAWAADDAGVDMLILMQHALKAVAFDDDNNNHTATAAVVAAAAARPLGGAN